MAQHKSIMKNNAINKVLLNGNVIRKNKNNGRLYLTMAVLRRSRTRDFVDYPTVVFKGEDAKRLDKIIPDADKREGPVFAEVTAYLDTERYMRRVPDERNRFEMVWNQIIEGESIEFVDIVRPKNEVILKGEITHVYKNDAPGKRFYLLTVNTDGHIVSVIYFDHDMVLEPEVGETVRFDGNIHTRVVREGHRPRTEFTVNAWRALRVIEKNESINKD